jgi:hypothetical protein
MVTVRNLYLKNRLFGVHWRLLVILWGIIWIGESKLVLKSLLEFVT